MRRIRLTELNGLAGGVVGADGARALFDPVTGMTSE